jgi:uncharacterized protein with FMN-binding domain
MNCAKKLANTIMLSSLIIVGLGSGGYIAAAQANSARTTSRSSPQVEVLNGTWEGTYSCAQGLTNLKLVIQANSANEIDAVFMFSPHPQNPQVPSGRFRMAGNLEISNSKDIPDLLDLKGTTWINRPAGYMLVDLRGDVSASKNQITGNVLAVPGCSTFDLVKTEQ